jgi:hypothetical protein
MADFRYILASVPSVFPIPISVGLCVPSECTAQDFAGFKSFLVPAINDIIPELFQGIKGFDPQTQISYEDLQFDDSVKLNVEVTEFNGGSFFICVVIFFFTVSVIVSSFMIWYFNKEDER